MTPGHPHPLDGGRHAVIVRHPTRGMPYPVSGCEVWVKFSKTPRVRSGVWWDKDRQAYNSKRKGVEMKDWFVVRAAMEGEGQDLAIVWVP